MHFVIDMPSQFSASGGPICLLQSETVVQTKRRHFIVFTQRNSNEFLEPLGSLGKGFSVISVFNRHFERGEGPGDEAAAKVNLI